MYKRQALDKEKALLRVQPAGEEERICFQRIVTEFCRILTHSNGMEVRQGKNTIEFVLQFLSLIHISQNNDVEIEAIDEKKNYRALVPECLRGKPLAQAFAENLARLEVCGQKGLSERFDASIGAGTVLMLSLIHI